jgi:hypothetical protein
LPCRARAGHATEAANPARAQGELGLAVHEWHIFFFCLRVGACGFSRPSAKLASLRNRTGEHTLLQSLLLTSLGGFLGIAGALLASQFQARNAEQERREKYFREDRYRLAGERISAYTAFYRSAGRSRSAMATHAHDRATECDNTTREALQTARNNLWDTYTVVGLIGDDPTERCAAKILDLVSEVSMHRAKLDRGEWSRMMKDYIRSARAELTYVNDAPE